MRSLSAIACLLAACSFAWEDFEPLPVSDGDGGAGGAATGAGAAGASSTGGAGSGGSGATAGSPANGGAGGAGGAGGGGGAGMTVTFGERPTADVTNVTRDTYVRSTDPLNNYGANRALIVDISGEVIERMLFHFDLSSLSSVTVIAADLRIVTESNKTASTTMPVMMYEVLEPWNEGTATSSAGTCNWQLRMEGVLWTTEGVGVGSRDSTPLASFTLPAIATEHSIPVPAGVVQSWIDSPGGNHGVVLVTDSMDGARVHSSDSSSEQDRPLLVVSF